MKTIYPHHPHFIAVEPYGGGMLKYTFRPFTGDEPEPEYPEYPAYVPEDQRTAEDNARLQECKERCQEVDALHNAWEEARYYQRITPLVEAAVKARPPVDEALDAMQRAWEELDNALVWPVAVKRLIDAQDKARTELDRWVEKYAYPLAKAEGSQSYYIGEHVANWSKIAEEITGQPVTWDIGWYYKGDSHCGANYSSDPRNDLERTIRQQRARLEEIARLSGVRNEPYAG